MKFLPQLLCACFLLADGTVADMLELHTIDPGFPSGKRCEPPIFEGLVVTPFQRYYEVGDEIELSCEEGYELTMGNRSTCKLSDFLVRESARFLPSVSSHVCRKNPVCYPPFEEGLVVTPFKPSYQVGEEISLSCEDGYALKTEMNTKICQEKRELYGYSYSIGFFPQRESCEKIQKCKLPLEVGLVVSPFKPYYEQGEEIYLECEVDFELRIDNVTVCTKSGYFEGIKRRMNIGDYYLPPLKSACRLKPSCEYEELKGLIVSPSKEYYMDGENITVSCEEGYDLIGANQSTCVAGYFDEYGRLSSRYGAFQPLLAFDTCRPRPKCRAPRRRGLMLSPEKDTYEEGSEVSLSCEEGYELTMADKVVCERSRFSKILSRFERGGKFEPDIGADVCRKIITCDGPKQKGLIVTPSSNSPYLVGDKISLTCEDGYKLFAPKSATCQATMLLSPYYPFHHRGTVGRFMPEIPLGACEELPTCAAPKPQEGLVVSPAKERYAIGEGISLSCEEGYELNHNGKSVCRIREPEHMGWAHFKPDIKPKACTKIPTCEKPEQEGLIVSPSSDEYLNGETVTLSCADGYALVVSEEERTCKNGRFRPRISEVACKDLSPCEAATTMSPKEMLKCLAKLFVEETDED